MVAFLADNTLGRLWSEMRGGDTRLAEQCGYLVKREGVKRSIAETPRQVIRGGSDRRAGWEVRREESVDDHHPVVTADDRQQIDCGDAGLGHLGGIADEFAHSAGRLQTNSIIREDVVAQPKHQAARFGPLRRAHCSLLIA